MLINAQQFFLSIFTISCNKYKVKITCKLRIESKLKIKKYFDEKLVLKVNTKLVLVVYISFNN